MDLGVGRKRRRALVDSDESDMEDDDNDVTIVENTDEANKTNEKRLPGFKFINTNARSLKPKLEAFYNCFSERNLDLAIVSETCI